MSDLYDRMARLAPVAIPYPPDAGPLAIAEIRALRLALLHVHGRIQTVEAWAQTAEESAHENYRAALVRRQRTQRLNVVERRLRP